MGIKIKVKNPNKPLDDKDILDTFTQIETQKAWQCPHCGDWFTDGETECGDCDYKWGNQ
jgi:DNA-directed RNA polymerase subunit RPC12/RpoP